MDVLLTSFVAQLLAIAGLGGLVAGLILPHAGAAVGVGLFIGILATFALASASGTPVPMLAWLLAVLVGMAGGWLGWFVRSRRRA